MGNTLSYQKNVGVDLKGLLTTAMNHLQTGPQVGQIQKEPELDYITEEPSSVLPSEVKSDSQCMERSGKSIEKFPGSHDHALHEKHIEENWRSFSTQVPRGAFNFADLHLQGVSIQKTDLPVTNEFMALETPEPANQLQVQLDPESQIEEAEPTSPRMGNRNQMDIEESGSKVLSRGLTLDQERKILGVSILALEMKGLFSNQMDIETQSLVHIPPTEAFQLWETAYLFAPAKPIEIQLLGNISMQAVSTDQAVIRATNPSGEVVLEETTSVSYQSSKLKEASDKEMQLLKMKILEMNDVIIKLQGKIAELEGQNMSKGAAIDDQARSECDSESYTSTRSKFKKENISPNRNMHNHHRMLEKQSGKASTTKSIRTFDSKKACSHHHALLCPRCPEHLSRTLRERAETQRRLQLKKEYSDKIRQLKGKNLLHKA